MIGEQNAWIVGTYHDTIKPVVLVKDTAQRFYIREKPFGGNGPLVERIVQKHRGYQVFVDFEVAKAWLIARKKDDIEGLRKNLERANGELGNIRGMKEPTNAV